MNTDWLDSVVWLITAFGLRVVGTILLLIGTTAGDS